MDDHRNQSAAPSLGALMVLRFQTLGNGQFVQVGLDASGLPLCAYPVALVHRINATDPDIARFMGYVEKLPSGCWYWTGARSRGRGNRKWYGSFSVGGRVVRAHRFASEVLAAAPCPKGHHRDHKCCFSMCVNPDHIEVVTAAENQRRKIARAQALAGRQA